MKINKLLFFSVLVTGTTMIGCKKDEPTPDPTIPNPTMVYDNGVFITNEGPFGSGTGTVSFYSRVNSSVYNDIFEAKNSFPLGNIVQSIEVFNNWAYIVVNNAGKVEIADANSFASNGTITGFTYPRYFLGIDNNKAYVSEWGTGGMAGSVKVVNLLTKTITSTINTGKGAEGMVKLGAKVFVACGGGFDNDSVVTIINSLDNTVDTTIVVGPNPSNIQVDTDGNVWVLCKGKYNSSWTALEQTGRLVKINGTTNVIELSLTFLSTFSQPSNLVVNALKNILYYNYDGKVYSHPIASTSLSSSATINRSFYGLGIDPVSNYFYASDALDFSSNGKVIRYTSAGVAIDSFNVGVIPGNFCFR
ncbi:MAG: hypothetical protein JNL69_12110 [Bacteroidia bacterium]|nr:hypothetical protein [Bacteroidia bacterium]